jgi:hypothetical protein
MTQGRLRAVLTDLVANGELTQAQSALVIAKYERDDPEPVVLGKRKWLGELGGYVGGVFTLTAGIILLGHTWSSISRAGKIGILVALAAILVGIGVFINGMRRGESSRRLAGTLIAFGAISAAGAGGNSAPRHRELLVASLVGFAIVSLGYWRVRSASSHVALFGLFTLLIGSIVNLAHIQRSGLAFVLFLVGLTWFALADRDLLTEKLLGLTIGAATMVVAGEFAFMNDSRVLAYALLAAIALVGFRIYITGGQWPPLAGAVAATTLGVGQIVGTTLGGALGAAIGLLAAGLALLLSSAWLLRRRK